MSLDSEYFKSLFERKYFLSYKKYLQEPCKNIIVCSVLAEPRDGDVRRDVRDSDGHPGARHLRHSHLPAAARE